MLSLRWSFRLALATICLVCSLNQVSASVEYCSGLNTANTNKNSSIYQSNGLCGDFCRSSYAFAVVQDDGCWCSNYAPGSTTDGCDTQCPGYPSDLCGGSGVYGYIALGNAVSGTEGGSTAAATSTQQSTSATQVTTITATPSAVTVVATQTNDPSPSPTPNSSSATATTTSDPTTTPTPKTTSTSSSSSSSTWTPTPSTFLETVTGEVRTVTVTPTVPPSSANSGGVTKSHSSSGISTGGAVGLTVGLVALVAIISAIVYFCIKKRRQEKEQEEYNNLSRRGSSAGLGGPVPSRTMSENSRYVLGTNGRDVVETWEAEQDPPGSRRSRLMPVDPRLDPFAPVYQMGENKSRESVNTLRDDHDYSRRVHQQGPILRATNPDT